VPRTPRRRVRDYREFVFTATGSETKTDDLSLICVYDNLIVEADRLKAIVGLLNVAREDDDGVDAAGLALVLGDIEKRTRLILELAVERQK